MYAVTKGWATLVTLGAAILLPVDLPILNGPYIIKAICWALWVFPIALCGGYWFSRIVFSVVDPDRK